MLAIDEAGARVACADGAVVIREVQAAGRKRMTAAQFSAGRGIAAGDVLAPPAGALPRVDELSRAGELLRAGKLPRAGKS